MKSNTFIFAAIVAFTLLLYSCGKNNLWGITGKGSNVTETRDLRGFDRISLRTDGNISYTQDSIFFVEITGQKNILNVLNTQVENNTLVVDFKKNVWKHNKLKITIHCPAIYALSISGSGNIEVQNQINTTYMELTISGSGNIHLPALTATTLEARLSGSGNMDIDGGSVSSQNLSISGSGNMDMLNMTSTNCTCKISGSGDMLVKALETLDVSISGSGNVKYSGFPRINSQISGSGKLTRI